MKQTSDGLQGGMLKGDPHSAPSGGIDAVVVTDNNKPVKLEGDEVIINKKSVKDPEVKTLRGTNKEILSQINTQDGNGVPILEEGGEINVASKNIKPNIIPNTASAYDLQAQKYIVTYLKEVTSKKKLNFFEKTKQTPEEYIIYALFSTSLNNPDLQIHLFKDIKSVYQGALNLDLENIHIVKEHRDSNSYTFDYYTGSLFGDYIGDYYDSSGKLKQEVKDNSMSLISERFSGSQFSEGGEVVEKITERLQERQKGKEFKDTGTVSYTRKYKAAYDLITSSDLVEIQKDNVTAYRLIEKSKIWPLYNVEELKEQGNTSGAAYLKVKCREFLSSRPIDTPAAREVYVKSIEKLRAGLEPLKNALSVKEYLKDFINLDKFEFGDLSFMKSVSYTYTSSTGNQAKYSNRDLQKYFDDIFGKKFYNFCKVASESAAKVFSEAFLYEAFTKENRQFAIDERFNKSQDRIKEFTSLLEELNAIGDDTASIKKAIDESGVQYFPYSYTKPQIIEYINKSLKANSENTKEQIEKGLSGIYTVREEDWSWANIKKGDKAAAPKDEEGKPRKPQNIFEKLGIEEPKVLKRTPLDFIKRTGGLEVGDVSTSAVLQNFGYRNIIYGNYVNDSESKEHTKHLLGAMLDLMEICNISVKDINALGGLDINIGSTGCGSFSPAFACYFPSLKAINITKKTGDGSVAHEWSHYLDNVLAEGTEKKATNVTWATSDKPGFVLKSSRVQTLIGEYKNWLMTGGKYRKITVVYYPQSKYRFMIYGETVKDAIEGIQKRYPIYKNYKGSYSNDLIKYYGYVAYKLNGNKPIEVELESTATNFWVNSSKFVPFDYYTDSQELFARSFEAWAENKLKEKGRASTYLVDVRSGLGLLAAVLPREEWPYPYGEELKWLNDWFERLFSAIRVDYNIKPFEWNTTERVDEYTEFKKDSKVEKVEAGVSVSDDEVIVDGGIEEFEKGFGFRQESLKDKEGKSRIVYRLLTDPYNRGRGMAVGGEQTEVAVAPLKYFSTESSGYGIIDGMTNNFPNFAMKLPTEKMEQVKQKAIEYYKGLNKTTGIPPAMGGGGGVGEKQNPCGCSDKNISYTGIKNYTMDLANHDILVGKMITDQLSTRKYQITDIGTHGLTLQEAHAIGTHEGTKHLTYLEIETKFFNGSITIEGYEKTPIDIKILHLVLKNIQQAFANAELNSHIQSREEQDKQAEITRANRDRFAKAIELAGEEETEASPDELLKERQEKIGRWIISNAPADYHDTDLDQIPEEVFTQEQLVERQILLDEDEKLFGKEFKKGGNVDDKKEQLNETLLESYDADSFVDKFIYLTSPNRGNHISEEELRAAYYNGRPVDVIEEYDPIAFNTEISYMKKGGSVLESGDILLKDEGDFFVINSQTPAGKAWMEKEGYQDGMAIAEMDAEHIKGCTDIKVQEFAKGGSIPSEISESEYNQFIDYVYSFYGKGGLYYKDFTKDEIKSATQKYLENKSNNWGGGDSLDRERVRDIVLASREGNHKNIKQTAIDNLTKHHKTITDAMIEKEVKYLKNNPELLSNEPINGDYVAVGKKGDYITIISKPTSKKIAQEIANAPFSVPSGEVAEVWSVDDVKKHKNVVGRQYLEKGGKIGGRGWFGFEEGNKINHVEELGVGDILLNYSKQFNAKNTIKLISKREHPTLVFDAVYWDTNTDKRIGNEEFSISDYTLKNENFYKPIPNKIKDQYWGKTEEQVWSEWTVDQKKHFLFDHADDITGKPTKSLSQKKRDELESYADKSYDKLPENIKRWLTVHWEQGQYGEGGKIIAITKISDIPNLQKKVDEGKVTYRGLGMGKLADDFSKASGGKSGNKIKVDGKEYYITDEDFNLLGGIKKIRFSAPFRKFEEGGAVSHNEENEVDLFEEYDTLPKKVQKVLAKYSNDEPTYKSNEKLLKELKPLGYTFEYGLDGMPYGLKKIEMKKGGSVDMDKIFNINDIDELVNIIYSKPDGIEKSIADSIYFGVGNDPYVFRKDLDSVGLKYKPSKNTTFAYPGKTGMKKYLAHLFKDVDFLVIEGDEYEKGGKLGFKKLSQKVASHYIGKSVPEKYQAKYGKVYSQEEAQKIGNATAAVIERNKGKMGVGGRIAYYKHGVEGGEREIERIRIWIGNKLETLPYSRQNLKSLIDKFNSEKYDHIVITDNGALYVTNDTPGYADGDKTVEIKELQRLYDGKSMGLGGILKDAHAKAMAFHKKASEHVATAKHHIKKAHSNVKKGYSATKAAYDKTSANVKKGYKATKEAYDKTSAKVKSATKAVKTTYKTTKKKVKKAHRAVNKHIDKRKKQYDILQKALKDIKKTK